MSELPDTFFKRLEAECLPRIEKVTVPLFGLQDDQIKLDRTGVLYTVGGHHFILTASHKLCPIVKNNIPLCVGRADAQAEPISLADAKFHCTEEDGCDVAAIKLGDGVVEKLLENKEFLQHSDIRLRDDSANGLYVLLGYPEDWSGLVAENSLRSVPLGYLCRPYDGERNPDACFHPDVHIVLGFDRTAVHLPSRDTAKLPPPNGMSGCGIWRVSDFSKAGLQRWRPERLCLVALQHRWDCRRKYVKGTWIGFALELVRKEYPDVSPAMDVVYPV